VLQNVSIRHVAVEVAVAVRDVISAMLKFAYRPPSSSTSTATSGAAAETGSRRPRDRKHVVVRLTSTSAERPGGRDEASASTAQRAWCVRRGGRLNAATDSVATDHGALDVSRGIQTADVGEFIPSMSEWFVSYCSNSCIIHNNEEMMRKE